MKIYVIGIGPGGPAEMTDRARQAVERCDVVAGYDLYIDMIHPLTDGKEVIKTGMTGEAGRCKAAIRAALSGKSACVVSGGDAGVYGMASLVLELAEGFPQIEIEVIPGVTAACAASAALGAPVSGDFAAISLSDRLTAWQTIEARLRAATQGDFMICLYNPASRARQGHLKKACAIILEQRAPETPCGVVRNAGRSGETVCVTQLDALCSLETDMFATIVIGNSATRVMNGRLVTPRGYAL